MEKYFHELSDEELDRPLENNEKTTWEEFAGKYPQPEWCSYPDALRGPFGCWSLMGLWGKDRRVRKIEDCKGCRLCEVPDDLQN